MSQQFDPYKALRQRINLRSVESFYKSTAPQDKIRDVILNFCSLRLNRCFYMKDLNRYVQMLLPNVAPDSPGRTLRSLKKKGILDYELMSRGNSIYKIKKVSRGTNL